MNDKYLNIKEASEMLGVSKLTLRNWDKAGKLNAYRHPINNYRMYFVEDLQKILDKIKSGEKPFPSVPKKETEDRKFYKLKVIHSEEWDF